GERHSRRQGESSRRCEAVAAGSIEILSCSRVFVSQELDLFYSSRRKTCACRQQRQACSCLDPPGLTVRSWSRSFCDLHSWEKAQARTNSFKCVIQGSSLDC